VPVLRWQRVQWQYVIASSGSPISNRTPPHRQPPLITPPRIFTAVDFALGSAYDRAVWGVVDDGATRVDVTIGTRTLHALLARNAFFLALPHGTVVPSRIVVRERDGARHVYVVKRLRPA
jgi:hypothetical protein